jgi:hypothetical protein
MNYELIQIQQMYEILEAHLIYDDGTHLLGNEVLILELLIELG